MELEKYEKAKEIRKEIAEHVKLYAFLSNSDTHVSLSKLDSYNEWETIRPSKEIKEKMFDFLCKITELRIKELEQQFNDL